MALQLLDGETEIPVQDTDLDGVTDGDPEVSYVVRQIEPSVNRAAMKKHTKPGRNGRDAVVDFDAAYDDLIDHALIRWTGFLWRGAEAPCTRENKLLLDRPRKMALLLVAGLNRSQARAEERAQSFPRPA